MASVFKANDVKTPSKKHLDKKQLNVISKVELLPISTSSKQILIKLRTKTAGTYQITDIGNVLKSDKSSVTIRAKINFNNIINQDIIMKIFKDGKKAPFDLEVFRSVEEKINRERLDIFHHENIIAFKMLKNFKTLKQMLEETEKIQEMFEEIINLIQKCKNNHSVFWILNMKSITKKIIYQDNQWKILSLSQCNSSYYSYSRDFICVNIFHVFESFKSYGMRNNELEESFSKFLDKKSSSVFNFMYQKYFIEGCKNPNQYLKPSA